MPARRRANRRKHPLSTAALIIGVLVLVATGGAGAYLALGRSNDAVRGAAATETPSPTTGATPSPTASPTAAPPRIFAATGPDSYAYAGGESAVFGTSGGLKKYRVAIETGTPVPVEEFASVVDTTLADPRSWIAGNNVRLQRVSGETAGHSFTVYLVTPGTAQKHCRAGGYDIFWRGEPYTSCRVGAMVLINIARYLTSVPDYGAPVEAYQQYAINHEVGHVLGHGHELCPGKGKPAPVMQQQTFDLQGCVAYGWPYLDGKRHAGPPGRIVPSG